MRILFKYLALIIITCSGLQAAQKPRVISSETKFRSYVYNPNYAYRYLGHYTYQGFVEFDEDEKVETISMGDPTLWIFQHQGNRLFLKPIGENNSQTNMTVITNKRVYHFELIAKEAAGIDDEELIFVAKFIYPDEKDKNIMKFPKAITNDNPDLRNLNLYNFNYSYVGKSSIVPVRVFDNGEFTYFQFSDKNAQVPAIFSVDNDGFESMVNYRATKDYLIVETVAPQYTLRNGADIVCVYNNKLNQTTYDSRAGSFPPMK